MLRDTMTKQESYLWPAVMAGASLMSVCGGILGLYFVPQNRENPFFYTSIANPAIYAGINIYRVCQIRESNRSFVQAEYERRNELKSIRVDHMSKG